MCDRLPVIRAALSRFAAAVDPAALSVDEAARIVAEAAAIEASAAAVKALAAARAADGGAYGGGERSTAEALAAVIGVGSGTARELIVTGRRLASQPEVAAAAKAGALSPAQTALVANAAAADPAASGRLLKLAGRSSLAALRNECARVKASVGDVEERRREIRARRRLHSWTDVEGVWHLTAQGNPEDGAQVMAALSPWVEARFRAARATGERESPGAYAFDALVELSRVLASVEDDPAEREQPGQEGGGGAGFSSSAGGDGVTRARARPANRRRRGAPVKLLVRIDYDTFLRGVSREGETCELVGYGPIAVSAVQDLVESGDPFVAAILSRGEALVGVAHLGRRPNATQRSALEWLYPSCAARDCMAQARLEADHRVDWAATHYTAFDLLDLLCHRHHALKTRENWALVEGRGKRDFVPPSDPRHPRHAGAAACA